MPVFERSWQNRLVRGRNILPNIRDQGEESTCSFYAVAGALESACKKVYAEAGQAFESEISIDSLKPKFNEIPLVDDVLSLICSEGALTVDSYQRYLNGHTDLERVKLKDYVTLNPQFYEQDFVRLLVHILSSGTAIGVFLVTVLYDDETTYYQEVGEPVFTDDSGEDDGSGDEEVEDVLYDDETTYYQEVGELVITDDSGEDGGSGDEEVEDVFHAVLLISFGMDEENNFYWRVLDSHGPNAGENGTRRIALYLIKEAQILVPET